MPWEVPGRSLEGRCRVGPLGGAGQVPWEGRSKVPGRSFGRCRVGRLGRGGGVAHLRLACAPRGRAYRAAVAGPLEQNLRGARSYFRVGAGGGGAREGRSL